MPVVVHKGPIAVSELQSMVILRRSVSLENLEFSFAYIPSLSHSRTLHKNNSFIFGDLINRRDLLKKFAQADVVLDLSNAQVTMGP